MEASTTAVTAGSVEPQKHLRIVRNLEYYDKILHAPTANQMEGSTTAVTAGSAERHFAEVFASMWYISPILIRPHYDIGSFATDMSRNTTATEGNAKMFSLKWMQTNASYRSTESIHAFRLNTS